MTKQLTPEDLEKMSPQSLVEFMTENIPADKLRACLQKVEEFPSESSLDTPTISVPDVVEPSEPAVNQIDVIRNKCSKYPVVVVKVGPVKGREGDHVHFYKKKGDVYKLVASPVETFDKDNCNLGDPTVTDIECQDITDWIQSKTKAGVLDKTIKTVMQEYVNNNSADFITNCENVKELLKSLEIDVPSETESLFENMSNQDKLDNLKRTCVYKAGILLGDLVKSDPKKALVYMPRKIADTGEYKWQRFRIDLDNIKNKWCESLEREIEGSEKYRLFSLGFSNTDPAIQSEIEKLVIKLRGEGIQIPYNFLEAGGSSSFGNIESQPACSVNTMISLSNQELTRFINNQSNVANVIKMEDKIAPAGNYKYMTVN